MNILKLLIGRGFKIFQRPYELNIIGVRSKNSRPKRFDDSIHVFYKNESNQWVYHNFNATTDPGRYYLNNPILPGGTAALIEGQYINAYAIGFHKGTQKSLVQTRPVSIVRDSDRNNKLSFTGNVQKGLFGINIHRASLQGSTKYIDRYSAGCQVFESSEDFDYFIELCDKHRALYSNKFTYTLIDKRQNYSGLIKGILGSLALGSLISYLTLKTKYHEK